MALYRKISFSLCCFLLVWPACFLLVQVSQKAILLNQIKRLPMPDDPADLVDVVFTTAIQAEVLAVSESYMCTHPARIMAPDDESCVLMLDEKRLRESGSWGHFHELGHRHQFWGIDFPAQSEVTVNLYTMYIYDKILKKGIYHHEQIPSREASYEKIRAYMASDPNLEKWAKNPFNALHMYVQLIDHFGWESILSLHKIYRALPEKDYPESEQDKIDFWFLSICQATGANLNDFFAAWGFPVSDAASEKVKSLPVWEWKNS